MACILKQITNVLFIKNLRGFRTSCSLRKENKVMRKIMGMSSAKKKHRYSETPILPPPGTFSQGAYEGNRSGNSRRVAVLNKLFMTHITDLMTTGPSASHFSGYGLEISRVQVASDYNIVNVFWIAKGTDKDDFIEKILQSNSGELRHELSQLRVMGVVPRIKFVKDKKYAQIMEVDLRLAQADFGDDYVPLEPAVKLKSHLELHVKLEACFKEQINKLDITASDDFEQVIPSMPQNVLGLDRDEIMKRIQKSLSKSQAVHRYENGTVDDTEGPKSVNLNPVEYSSEKVKREAFKQFLLQRQILRNKAQKLDKNYQPEAEYLKEEGEKQKEQLLESFDFENFYEADDYFEEDDIK